MCMYIYIYIYIHIYIYIFIYLWLRGKAAVPPLRYSSERGEAQIQNIQVHDTKIHYNSMTSREREEKGSQREPKGSQKGAKREPSGSQRGEATQKAKATRLQPIVTPRRASAVADKLDNPCFCLHLGFFLSKI